MAKLPFTGAGPFLILIGFLAPAQAEAQAPKGSEKPPEVRVVSTSGAVQTARLISLTSAEVMLRKGDRETRTPLSEVARIERVTHRARGYAIAGAAAGFVAAKIIYSQADDIQVNQAALMCALFGAGVGGLAGLISDSQPAVLYLAPPGRQVVEVRPLLGPNRAGLALVLGW